MANVPQPGSGPPPLSQIDPNSSGALSWEGDKMFNIYIYDYCIKRGFRKTARELLAEAEIPQESHPPINARQGLLFEWWSVFWVLFTAKANGSGTEEALLYTQHQAQQATNRARQQAVPPPMQQPPVGRPAPGRPFMANGVLPNTGTGAPGAFPPGAHINGVPGPQGPQPPPNQPGQPPQTFQPSIPAQRGPPRVPNGVPPFQSPTMANSPQTTGSAPGQPQPLQQGQPPMGQLGPSPHMGPMQNRMLPPNQGMQPGQPQSAPPGAYPLGRPPSRTASPGQMGGMLTQSPSMANRQPPGMMPPLPNNPQALDAELSRISVPLQAQLRAEIGLEGKDVASMTYDEKQRIVTLHRTRSTQRKPGPPPGPLNAPAGSSNMLPPAQRHPSAPAGRTKRNSTSPGEEPESMPGAGSSPPDRKRLRRSPTEQSPLNYSHQPPQMPQQPPQPGPGGPGSGPPQQPPVNNGGMMRPMPINSGFQGVMPPQQLGGQMNMNMGNPGGPHQMNNAMSPSMAGGMPGQGGVMTSQMQPMATQQQQQNRDAHYRNTLNSFHARQMHQSVPQPAAASPGAEPPFNANGAPGQGAPPPSVPPFAAAGGGPNRGMPPKPAPPGSIMPPPPSPGMNKDVGKPDMKPDGSPQNAINAPPPPNPSHTPTTTGTAGSTPVPGAPTISQPPPPQNPTPNPPPNMASSPSSILGNPPMSSMMPTSASNSLFNDGFMADLSGGLEDFQNTFFDASSLSGSLDFERDFSQWFNPNDDSNLDSMK